MPKINVRGAEFNFNPIRDSHNRRAQQFHNSIISSLKKIEVSEDDIEISLEANCRARAPAFCDWYFDGFNLHFSCKLYDKFAENLFVVSKVIEYYVNLLLNEELTLNEFTSKFMEEEDIDKQRDKARELLGVDKDCVDSNEINKKYKDLAKKYHPDMPEGNIEKFKAINNAHKMLKRELD